jgi:hypothetical protein
MKQKKWKQNRRRFSRIDYRMEQDPKCERQTNPSARTTQILQPTGEVEFWTVCHGLDRHLFLRLLSIFPWCIYIHMFMWPVLITESKQTRVAGNPRKKSKTTLTSGIDNSPCSSSEVARTFKFSSIHAFVSYRIILGECEAANLWRMPRDDQNIPCRCDSKLDLHQGITQPAG